jgi:DNA-binding winged helix-turn-helix (wHTH) protein
VYEFPKGRLLLKFAEFRLDLEARQLHRGREERHLSPKAFDLLAILIAHRPGVVDKDALRDRLWPGTNVVDANLNNLASEIRLGAGRRRAAAAICADGASRGLCLLR